MTITINFIFKVSTFLAFLLVKTHASTKLVNQNIALELTLGENITSITLSLEGNVKITGQIGEGYTLTEVTDCGASSTNCFLTGNGVTLNITQINSGFLLSWLSDNVETTILKDCIDLNVNETNWFGGPELWNQQWPIENVVITEKPYVSSKIDFSAIAERYWLNSLGAFIFVDDRVPLFLDQNNLNANAICYMAKVQTPYLGRQNVRLEYALVAKSDVKQAHMHASEFYLGSPTGTPNPALIENPIWTTWAKYKKDINDETVRAFALDISDHGFTGQIEIDDYWETCYGSLAFNTGTFANITETVQYLKDLTFSVTLWTHPFVNEDCQQFYDEGQANGYFATDGTSGVIGWWDGFPAYHIDFTKESAQTWFKDRLELLRTNHGIDNFKFDAGESDWAPENSVLTGDIELSPNLLTSNYVRTCATFGDRLEVRSGWRTQDLPVLVRMLDKDSRWGLDNGLHTLITTLLAFNIAGYTLVLPDMIGGNGYAEQPTAELIVRWTQANVFMPVMQFSYLPWEFSSDQFDPLTLTKEALALRTNFIGDITGAMSNSVIYGIPVNPPVWWVDPLNPDAWKINDEFMLGESLLIAPVIIEGATTRNIFLPTGRWQDGNTAEIYDGPITIENYPAPINILPYFRKI